MLRVADAVERRRLGRRDGEVSSRRLEASCRYSGGTITWRSRWGVATKPFFWSWRGAARAAITDDPTRAAILSVGNWCCPQDAWSSMRSAAVMGRTLPGITAER
jgi:hypothetical protein